jgi:hypothetical protein
MAILIPWAFALFMFCVGLYALPTFGDAVMLSAFWFWVAAFVTVTVWRQNRAWSDTYQEPIEVLAKDPLEPQAANQNYPPNW